MALGWSQDLSRNSHVLQVEKINIEQRKKIEELEHHLQNAEGQLSEGQTEAKLKAEELAMDRGMWLPYWFASRSEHCQELASVKWRLHGKPAVDALMQKVVRTLTHAQRLVEPHLQATQNVCFCTAIRFMLKLKTRINHLSIFTERPTFLFSDTSEG